MAPTPTRQRRRKQEPQEDVIPDSIFDALNASSPDGQQPGAQTQTKPGKEPDIAALMKQLEDMQKRQDELERANFALTTPVATSPVLPEAPKLNLEGLPDPVSDPKGYAATLAQRTTDFTAAQADFRTKTEQATQAKAGNFQQLWEDFSIQYGDYADDQEGVEFAMAKVQKQMQRRGIDQNRYMFQNSDRFFRDITKAYDERFGPPDGTEPQPQPKRDTSPAPRIRRVTEPDQGDGDEPQRTAGIFGGIDGSGGNRGPKAPPPGDMIKDLQDVQRKSGYY